MSVPVHCPSCGLRFVSRMFSISNSTGITLSGNRESCPRCGQMANVQDGVYDFVGDTISSFRRLDAANIQRFQSVLEAAEAGEVAVDAVVSEAATFGPDFGKLVAALQAVGGLPLLVALLALYLQYAAYRDDNADQEAVLMELRASNAHQEELIEGMRNLIASQDTPEPQPYSQRKPATTKSQAMKASEPDRAARRRAWKQEKKTTMDNSIKFER